MRFLKWEGWPWKWREVRRAEKISAKDRELFERYGEAVVASILASNPSTTEIHAHISGQEYKPSSEGSGDRRPQARDWLTERGDAHERHEQIAEFIEVGVVVLITIEIVLSLVFGGIGISDARKQGKVLDHLDSSAAATAETMKAVRDELKSLASDQAKAREILEEQERDRLAQLAKRPRLVLYAGNLPLSRPHGPLKPTNETETSATFDLVLRNDGDAAAHQITFRVLMPRGAATAIFSSGLSQNLPGYALGDGRTVAYQWRQDSLWPKTYLQISVTVSFQKGSSPFQISFRADADELTTDTPLGVLTISPLKG